MKTTHLAILLKDYPFQKGEPYFHRELHSISKNFERIILFVNHRPKSDSKKHFDVPKNVDIVNISTEFSGRQLLNLFKGFSLDELVSRTPPSVRKVRAMHYYLRESESLQKNITNYFQGLRADPRSFVWYSYWSDELAFVLARMKHRGIITNAISRTHNHDIYESRHPNSYLPFRTYIFKHLTKILCISDHGRLHLAGRFPDYAEKIICERLGVDTYKTTSKQISERPITLLSLSGILPVKQLDFMIDTFSKWNGSEIHWHHIGSVVDENYSKKVYEMARELLEEKENVKYWFHGYVKLENVIDRLKKINPHFLINASTFEGIPVSMMEAFSLGIPVIGTDVCGVPEIISNRQNGFLFTPKNVDELLSILSEIEDLTERQYQTMKTNAQQTQLELYNAEKNYDKLTHHLTIGGSKDGTV